MSAGSNNDGRAKQPNSGSAGELGVTNGIESHRRRLAKRNINSEQCDRCTYRAILILFLMHSLRDVELILALIRVFEGGRWAAGALRHFEHGLLNHEQGRSIVDLARFSELDPRREPK